MIMIYSCGTVHLPPVIQLGIRVYDYPIKTFGETLLFVYVHKNHIKFIRRLLCVTCSTYISCLF